MINKQILKDLFLNAPDTISLVIKQQVNTIAPSKPVLCWIFSTSTFQAGIFHVVFLHHFSGGFKYPFILNKACAAVSKTQKSCAVEWIP